MRVLIIVFFLLFGSVATGFAGNVDTMNKDELKSMLGSNDIVVLDVRAGRDWSSSEFKIKGAVREDPGDVSAWAANYGKDKTVVLYCA